MQQVSFFGTTLEHSRHVYLYHLTNLLRSSMCLMLCYRGNPLQSIRLCTFWARPPFVPMDMHFASCAMSFRVTPLHIYHAPAHLFHSLHLSFPVQHQLQRLTQLQQSPVPLQFTFPGVVITPMLSPSFEFSGF